MQMKYDGYCCIVSAAGGCECMKSPADFRCQSIEIEIFCLAQKQ